MIHLISEDSKSGADMWELILSLSVEPFRIDRCFGIEDLQSKLGTIITSRAKESLSQDTLVIVYDNTSISLQKFMRILQRRLSQTYQCFMTDYTSFESAILQFTKLQEWITTQTAATSEHRQLLLNTFAIVADLEPKRSRDDEFWNYEGEYYGVIKEFYEMLDSSTEVQDRKIRTREQALASLLAQLTNNTGFHITKSKIGACWRESCCWGEDQLSPTFKKHCGIEEYLTAQEKILELIDHSGFTNCLRDVDGDVVSLHDALEISYFL